MSLKDDKKISKDMAHTIMEQGKWGDCRTLSDNKLRDSGTCIKRIRN